MLCASAGSTARRYGGTSGRRTNASPRGTPRSTWSKVNRERVERLTAAGLMMPPGQALVDHAKQTGTWDLLADAQNLFVPPDLQGALDQNPQAHQHFRAFPPSTRRTILEWITLAKRPETRATRIHQTVTEAAHNRRANHPPPLAEPPDPAAHPAPAARLTTLGCGWLAAGVVGLAVSLGCLRDRRGVRVLGVGWFWVGSW